MAAKKQIKTARKRKPASAEEAVERQLATYRSMRDFKITSEPSGGGKRSTAKLPFVIQKHAATRLHYDFRLGWAGVLKSWAVAKGPSYVTKDKRLAVQVEDHPIEYGGFEGVIPKGQYGGGTVLLWDEGTWEPQPGHEDVDAGLRDGSLKFVLHGIKMKGKWALIRMGGRAANESKPNWLLIKEHDEFERTEKDFAITEEATESVVTGRGLEEIAKDGDHVWNSKESASQSDPDTRKPSVGSKRSSVESSTKASRKSVSKAGLKKQSGGVVAGDDLGAYPSEKMPEFVPPQLATQAVEATDADGWIHELKLDGYRIQALHDGTQVRLKTRTGLDWTHRMKEIAADVAVLPLRQAVLDGEVVALDETGLSSFAYLQASFQEGAKHPLTYMVFDLLHLDGHNLRQAPLVERKGLLQGLLDSSPGHAPERVRLSEHIEEIGRAHV